MNQLQAMILWDRMMDRCGADVTLATGGAFQLPYNLTGLADPEPDLIEARRFLIGWCNALGVMAEEPKPQRVVITARTEPEDVPEAPSQPNLGIGGEDDREEPTNGTPPPERKNFPARVGGRVVIGPREMAWRCGVTQGCILAWVKSGRLPDSVWVRFGSGGASGRTFYAFKKTEALDWIRHGLVHV